MKTSPFEVAIRLAATSAGISLGAARRLLKAFEDQVRLATWARGRFEIPKFVTFKVRARKSKNVRNPITGMTMVLPPRRAVAARASGVWRARPHV